MSENMQKKNSIRKLDDSDMNQVNGGIWIDGKQYVKVDTRKISGNEYRCSQCGHIVYKSGSLESSNETLQCPRCNAIKLNKTGRFYMPYNQLHASGEAAYWNAD